MKPKKWELINKTNNEAMHNGTLDWTGEVVSGWAEGVSQIRIFKMFFGVIDNLETARDHETQDIEK